ncbi:unnamed protein product [Periconia digitata]|uniref:Uncharacterized protein n=1 Tax=Periconia digitata TaxID=1303443 RepID=A0A9W4XSS9_9PLEO|nr:unnamed protein product [Periconia digitata]
MHRKTPISVLVYHTLFPKPSPTDPPSFSAHLSKDLVGEVRIETATFYGSLETIEARYPGLNYAYAPHRKRLGRFPHHKRLFEAFDILGLTDSEIQGFCRWEGTLWARERYERDEGCRVLDTTGMDIGEWVDRRKTRRTSASKAINVKTDIEVEIEEMPAMTARSHHLQHHHVTGDDANMLRPTDTEMPDSAEPPSDDDDDDEPDIDERVGFELNARLMHAASLREEGAHLPMDAEWEQFLKDAQERGELDVEATRSALRMMASGPLGEMTRRLLNGSNASTSTTTNSSSQTYQPPAAPA